MRRVQAIAFVSALLIGFCVAPAGATSLVPGSGWQHADWDCSGGAVCPPTGAVATFELTALSPATTVTLLDIFTTGDEFRVNAAQLGDPIGTDFVSTAVTPGTQPCNLLTLACNNLWGSNAASADFQKLSNNYLALGKNSIDVFTLAPGDWVLTIFITKQAPQLDANGIPLNVPNPFGNASIRADVTAVPEPASLLLLGTGIAGLAARRRRKA